MRLPPLNALRAFESAARQMSLRRAAAELHVTPAAISHQVRALESVLGVSLFRRLPGRVELTPAGEVFIGPLSEAFEQLTEAVATVRRVQNSGRVTVAAPPAFAAKWLAPRLHRFTARYQEIDLRISADGSLIDIVREDTGDTGNLLEEADLAIRSGDGDYPGYVVERLFLAYAIPMCHPRLLQGDHALRTPDDLRHHTLLHFSMGGETDAADRPNWNVWLEAAGVKDFQARRGPTFNQVAMALEAAADGMGVVLGIPVVAASDLAAGRLVMPFPLALRVKADYFLVHSHDVLRDPAVAAFRNWLVEEAANETWAVPPGVGPPPAPDSVDADSGEERRAQSGGN